MQLNLNPHSKQALYSQIYQEIKALIHSGELRYQDQLPSKRRLAAQNGVSQNTVINAYDQLLTEGYIYAKERYGYYVADVSYQVEPPRQVSAPEETPAPQPVFDFSLSVPDTSLFPFRRLRQLYQQILKSEDPSLLAMTHPQGDSKLRHTVQAYLSQSRGVPCSSEQIILGPSSSHLLQLLIQLLKQAPTGQAPQPQGLAIEDPGFHSIAPLFEHYQMPVLPIPLDDQGLDSQALSKSPANLVFTTPNHQYPTGIIMPLARRLALLRWANEADDRYIIEDDYDSEFKYGGQPIPGLKHLDQQQKVIYLGSFSRTLAPSVRLSYMVLPDRLMDRYHQLPIYQSTFLNTLNQRVLAEFMETGELVRHLNRSRSFYRKKRDQLLQAIHQLDPDAKISGGEAGLHILLQPSFAFDPDSFKAECLAAGLKIKFLSDLAIHQTQDMDQTLFLSFSQIDSQLIEATVDTIYQMLKHHRTAHR